MLIYNGGNVGANIYIERRKNRNNPKKVVEKTTSFIKKKKLCKRNLKFLQALGLKVIQ